MHTEEINEPVGVIASFRQGRHGAATARPEIMHWRGRRYRIGAMGLRYPTTKGSRMLHRFTFSINDTAFELEFDAETLSWQLLSVNSNTSVT